MSGMETSRVRSCRRRCRGNGDIADRDTGNKDGSSSRYTGQDKEDMRGQRRLRFLDGDHNGRRHTMETDGADTDMEEGTTMKQAQEWGENNGEAA